MEPKRLATTEVTPSDIKRCRLNSTGSEDQSPPVSYNSESRSPSPVTSPDSKSETSSLSSPSSKRNSLSPMCLAPKKRFKFDALRDLEQLSSDKAQDKSEVDDKEAGKSPFRPWSGSASEVKPGLGLPHAALPGHPYIPFLLPGLLPPTQDGKAQGPLQAILPGLDPRLYGYLPPYLPLPGQPRPEIKSEQSASSSSPPPPQEEPLSLVIRDKQKDNNTSHQSDTKSTTTSNSKSSPIKISSARPPTFNVEALINAQKAALSSSLLQQQQQQFEQQQAKASSASGQSCQTKPLPETPTRSRHDSGSTSSSGGDAEKCKQRNYKNMTRERRVEANARERQRVHTITAAFDTLQAAIPTEEKDVKLSKLSVIKIATAYIMALSRMAGHDYTEDQSAPPVDEVIAHCSDVIEKECRIKKRNGSP